MAKLEGRVCTMANSSCIHHNEPWLEEIPKREVSAMIYVLSDIHGQRKRFDSILKQINLQPEDTLYVLGDVIDRYPDGIRILRQLMAMPNVKMLQGNHEFMMLRALYEPVPEDYLYRAMRLWYRNGGGITHEYLKRIRKTMRQEVFEYLSKLPLSYEITVNERKYLLVHGAPACFFPDRQGKYLTEREFSVWKRYDFDLPQLENTTIIFGHTPTNWYQICNPMQIWHGEGWIGIDCGATYPERGDSWSGYFGRLACLRLDDMKEFYSVERFKPATKKKERNA